MNSEPMNLGTLRNVASASVDNGTELRGSQQVYVPDLEALLDETGDDDDDGGLPA